MLAKDRFCEAHKVDSMVDGWGRTMGACKHVYVEWRLYLDSKEITTILHTYSVYIVTWRSLISGIAVSSRDFYGLAGWLSQTFLYSVKVRILFFTAFACINAIHFTQNWSIEETQDLALSVNVEVNRDLALRNWTATIYYIQCDNSISTLSALLSSALGSSSVRLI